MTKEERVRFAPSPTGELHIGSARTALFNYLFARARGGKMILRIEDTDEKRSTDESLRTIIDGLKWLGMGWDEGPEKGGISPPYFQSERIELHREYARKLIDSGKAYFCECPGGEGIDRQCLCMNKDQKALSEPGKAALRFHVPDGSTEVIDLIRGKVVFDNREIKDFIIMKSNNIPVYNFAVVVDDITMGVTHVIRGEDHLSNTPKQILIYQALGAEIPIMAHLPLINSPLGGKLSKRQLTKPQNDPKSSNYVPAVNVEWYRDNGFLPEAIVNYLARLGWSDGTDNEFFSLADLEKKFAIECVAKTPALFDWKKLKWFNGKYIRDLSPSEYVENVIPYLQRAHGIENVKIHGKEWIEKLMILYQERIEYFVEIGPTTDFYFNRPTQFDPRDISKVKWDSESRDLTVQYIDILSKIGNFTEDEIEKATRSFVETKGVELGRLIHPARLAISGTRATPGIFAVLNLLGKDETTGRLKFFIDNVPVLNP